MARIWTDEEVRRAVPYAAALLSEMTARWAEAKSHLIQMRICQQAGDDVGQATHDEALQHATAAFRRARREVEAIGACLRGRMHRPWLLFPLIRGNELGWRMLLLGSGRAGRFVRMASVPAAIKEQAKKRRRNP